ncbi:MAG: hypothetical protein QXT61_05065 [Candidatus Caldarchaeum sp.]
MDRQKIVLVLTTASLLVLFNLFQTMPPFGHTSFTLDLSFGESPLKPYLLRVRVEKITVVNGVEMQPRFMPRLIVKMDEKVGVTNFNGYTYFSTTPGKHMVTISSPQSLLPTYSVEIEIETPVTELRVRYVEYRLRITAVNISIDTSTSTSYVVASYTSPPNSTVYVGSPYLTYIDFKQYYKVFTGEGLTAYLNPAETPYQGPFTYIVTPETPETLTTAASVPDMIQIVSLEESYVPVYRVENELLRMM